jgi:hypothetical protein
VRNNKLFAVIVLTLFFNLFFLHSFGNLGFVIWALGVFLFFSFLFKPAKNLCLTFFVVLSLLSLELIFRANGFVILLLSLSILFVLFSYVYLSVRRLSFFRSWQEVIFSPIKMTEDYITSFFSGVFAQNNLKTKVSHHGRNWQVVARGLIIAFPIVLVLILLLSGADPIYGKFIHDIFNIQIDFRQEIWQRIVFSLFVFSVLFPFIFFKIKSENPPVLCGLSKLSIISEMGIVMFLIAIILASFLIIQFPYVFVNVAQETSLAQFGVATYSEYVRRGFIELIFASLVVYGTVWLGLVSLRHGSAGNKKLLIYLQLGVIAELLIFIFSLYRRIWLYQSLHGWSLVRIYGGIFLVWLTFMIMTLAWRHFAAKHWVLKEGIFTFFVIIFVGFFNAEGFIATSVHPPTVNGRVDYVYLSRLSPDGYEGWKKAYEYATEVLVLRGLQNKALINRDERREVAYAGLIVGQLSENHDRWFWQFKNEDEEKTELIKMVEDSIYRYNDDKFFQDVRKEIINDKDGKTNINIYTDKNFGNFYSNRFDNTVDWGKQSFYTVIRTDNYGRKYNSFFDKVFNYNYSAFATFQQFKTLTDIDDLIRLQRAYFQLGKKISLQPENEHDFEFDISLDSPFIDVKLN